VDDLAIVAQRSLDSTPSLLDKLIADISKIYELKVDRIGSAHVDKNVTGIYRYIGYDIEFDDLKQNVTLSMPNYIPKMIKRFCPDGNLPKFVASPEVYVSPNYGSSAPQLENIDMTAQLSDIDEKYVREVLGCAQYYGRAIDHSIYPAASHIASEMSPPTQTSLKATNRLFAYMVHHPNHKLVYNACDMQLHVQSDASYLSRSGSRSVAGGIHYLSDADGKINGFLDVLSKPLPTICSSVAEAEYGALFLNGQKAVFTRTALDVLGYPQPPTKMLTDSEVAYKIVNNLCKLRKSKSNAMRYNWIRDRVQDKEIEVYWGPGIDNLSDFMTKPQPVHKFNYLLPYIVNVTDN
jgi:hypothetical protein